VENAAFKCSDYELGIVDLLVGKKRSIGGQK